MRNYSFYLFFIIGLFSFSYSEKAYSCAELFSRAIIFDLEGEIKREYKEMEGYVRFSNEYFGGEKKENGNMQTAFQSVSSILEEKFKELNWQQFQGTTEEFRNLKSEILNPDGEVREEFKGTLGYVLFSKKFFKGDMLKTFINTSAALGRNLLKKLIWKKFQGSTTMFSLLIKDFRRHYADGGYDGVEGQKRVGDKIFDSNYLQTYNNVSALSEYLFGDREDFVDLGWIRILK